MMSWFLLAFKDTVLFLGPILNKCCPFLQEQADLTKLFKKYIPCTIDMVVEGIVDGKQGERLKTIVPQTDLNMVSYKLTRTLQYYVLIGGVNSKQMVYPASGLKKITV